MESAVSFAPLRPMNFVNFAGRGKAYFLRGGAGQPVFPRGGAGRGCEHTCLALLSWKPGFGDERPKDEEEL